MMQKGQAGIFILVGILILVGVAGGAFLLGRQTVKPQSQNPVITSQTLQSVPVSSINPSSDFISNEINNFPIYPNAKFIEKRKIPPCEKDKYSGFNSCNSITYTWQVNENMSKILNWYQNNNSGWKLMGGAGQYDDENGGGTQESYSKGNLFYDLSLQGFPNPTTITLIVRLGSPEGN